jgi:hypothetical protein
VDLPAGTLPRAGDQASRWRRAALLAAGAAAAELVILVVVALAFVAKPFAHSDGPAKAKATAAAAATPAPSVTGAAPAQRANHREPRLARSHTGVLVLNGNGEHGAAAQKAIVVRSLDYPVVGTADAARRDFPRTIVMYRKGFTAEALRFARDLGLPRSRAVPLDGIRGSDLHGAKLVLIVGRAA